MAALDRIIYRLIADRRASGERRDDLLSMLMDAVDDDGLVMDDTQLRDEVMTLILAGFETTTNALTWTWQLLGEHPFIDEKLRDELDAELGGRRPAATDLRRLRFTEMVFTESMRLYPPAWVIGRMATENVTIGPWNIPQGAIVFVSPYAMHRDPRFYTDPLAFNPWRWEEPARSQRPTFAYFPFGGGPRVCIGEGFARMEGILVLATIAQQWHLRPLGSMPNLHAAITLRPRGPVLMRVESRERVDGWVAASG